MEPGITDHAHRDDPLAPRSSPAARGEMGMAHPMTAPHASARVTRADLIAEARTWIGTPWIHQGRLKGIATDCVGVVICVPRALGLMPPDFDITGYARDPQPQVMIRYLELYLDRVSVPSPFPLPEGEGPTIENPKSKIQNYAKGGDVLLVVPRRVPQHLQILTFDGTVIGAIDRRRGVREHILDTERYPIASVWRYRGIEE